MAEVFLVPGKKSIYHAKKFLNIGKLKLKNGNYFRALENFNKCLCYSDVGSDEFSLALDYRSHVFREISQVKKNLEVKLSARAKVSEENSDYFSRKNDDPWNFFKLSYPPNKSVPFIVNCLELRNDESFGRYITTSRDLRPGDILAIEEPFFKIVDKTASHFRCANCLRSNFMNLVPSSLSSSCECFLRK